MEPRTIQIHDCEFSTYIFEEEIIARINMLAEATPASLGCTLHQRQAATAPHPGPVGGGVGRPDADTPARGGQRAQRESGPRCVDQSHVRARRGVPEVLLDRRDPRRRHRDVPRRIGHRALERDRPGRPNRAREQRHHG